MAMEKLFNIEKVIPTNDDMTTRYRVISVNDVPTLTIGLADIVNVDKLVDDIVDGGEVEKILKSLYPDSEIKFTTDDGSNLNWKQTTQISVTIDDRYGNNQQIVNNLFVFGSKDEQIANLLCDSKQLNNIFVSQSISSEYREILGKNLYKIIEAQSDFLNDIVSDFWIDCQNKGTYDIHIEFSTINSRDELVDVYLQVVDNKLIGLYDFNGLDYSKILGDELAQELINLHKTIVLRKESNEQLIQKNGYKFLSRLQSDCEYIINNQEATLKHLYYSGNVNEHINQMRQLFDMLEEKPDWLSLEKIEEYETALFDRAVSFEIDDALNLISDDAIEQIASEIGVDSIEEREKFYFQYFEDVEDEFTTILREKLLQKGMHLPDDYRINEDCANTLSGYIDKKIGYNYDTHTFNNELNSFKQNLLLVEKFIKKALSGTVYESDTNIGRGLQNLMYHQPLESWKKAEIKAIYNDIPDDAVFENLKQLSKIEVQSKNDSMIDFKNNDFKSLGIAMSNIGEFFEDAMARFEEIKAKREAAQLTPKEQQAKLVDGWIDALNSAIGEESAYALNEQGLLSCQQIGSNTVKIRNSNADLEVSYHTDTKIDNDLVSKIGKELSIKELDVGQKASTVRRNR